MRLLLGILVVLVVGCGSDFKGVTIVGDPRCEELCTARGPELPGHGRVCSTESVKRCILSCNQRLTGVSPICASCLLEDADFDQPYQATPGYCSDSSSITTGNGEQVSICTGVRGRITCSYSQFDKEEWKACYKQWYPDVQEVDCKPDFESVTECAELCG